MAMTSTRSNDVVVLALDGCMASCVAGVLDILRLANGLSTTAGGGPIFAVRVATPSGDEVIGFGGAPIRADVSLAELGRPDVVVVPPILSGLDESLARHRDLIEWLAARAASGAVMASVCTGAFFLAEAGLLDGRRATTYPGRAVSFRRRYPKIRLETDQRLVDEGAVVSAGATTSYLDLALHLVERYAGHEIAVLAAKVLAVDKNRLSQRPYFLHADQRDHGDADVLRVQDWLEQHHRKHIDAPQLSAVAGMSPRTLNRRFRAAVGESPVAYLHRIRIEAAKRLLEETRSNIDEITRAVGYGDARSFSRLFKRQTSFSPGDYRQRFGTIVRP
jgi:transcriptional regulator GlxA family with amidase domain